MSGLAFLRCCCCKAFKKSASPSRRRCTLLLDASTFDILPRSCLSVLCAARTSAGKLTPCWPLSACMAVLPLSLDWRASSQAVLGGSEGGGGGVCSLLLGIALESMPLWA